MKEKTETIDGTVKGEETKKAKSWPSEDRCWAGGYPFDPKDAERFEYIADVNGRAIYRCDVFNTEEYRKGECRKCAYFNTEPWYRENRFVYGIRTSFGRKLEEAMKSSWGVLTISDMLSKRKKK